MNRFLRKPNLRPRESLMAFQFRSLVILWGSTSTQENQVSLNDCPKFIVSRMWKLKISELLQFARVPRVEILFRISHIWWNEWVEVLTWQHWVGIFTRQHWLRYWRGNTELKYWCSNTVLYWPGNTDWDIDVATLSWSIDVATLFCIDPATLSCRYWLGNTGMKILMWQHWDEDIDLATLGWRYRLGNS